MEHVENQEVKNVEIISIPNDLLQKLSDVINFHGFSCFFFFNKTLNADMVSSLIEILEHRRLSFKKGSYRYDLLSDDIGLLKKAIYDLSR